MRLPPKVHRSKEMTDPTIQRALISVSDKSGVIELAEALHDAGIELFSSGGTRKHLSDAGVPFAGNFRLHRISRDDGRAAQDASPESDGGILCRRDHEQDLAQAAEHGILPFELVVVNLYPFEQTVARPDVTLGEAIEKIDIGGPTLIRAAAKNHAFVTVLTSPRPILGSTGRDPARRQDTAGVATATGRRRVWIDRPLRCGHHEPLLTDSQRFRRRRPDCTRAVVARPESPPAAQVRRESSPGGRPVCPREYRLRTRNG